MIWSGWRAFFRAPSHTAAPTGLRLASAAVSGAALSLSYTGFYLSIYSWICIGVLLAVLLDARARVAFACGFLHGLFFCLTSLPWIATVLAVHGGLSRVTGWALLLLMASAWGTLTGAFGWTIYLLARRNIAYACIGAPFLWVALEFFRAHLPEIGFPWNLLGYPASTNLGLLQLTTITGIYGLSFLVASFNALLAWTFEAQYDRSAAAASPNSKRRIILLAAATAFFVISNTVGRRVVPVPGTNHLARAVQVNFPESPVYTADWFASHSADLREINRLSLVPGKRQPDLLVWPEAPAPFSFQDPQFAAMASSLASRFHHPFLVGAIEWKAVQGSASSAANAIPAPYNSALLFDAQGRRVFSYDKIHLVPFGEYEPFPLIHRLVNGVSDEVGGFHKGQTYAVAPLPGGYSFAVFICYEAIFPNEVRRFAINGAQLFVNISNDGWFGRSAAPEQHLRMARVRAVENRRWIVRATNNGYTLSIDPYGRIIAALPPDVRAAADLPYDFRTDTTIYTRFGDWFAWLCVLVSVILVAATFWKGKISRENIPAATELLASSFVVSDPV